MSIRLDQALAKRPRRQQRARRPKRPRRSVAKASVRRPRRPGRQLHPDPVASRYGSQLAAIATRARALVDQIVIPELPRIERMAGIEDINRLDAPPWLGVLARLLRTVRQRMAEEIDPEYLDRLAGNAAIETADYNKAEMTAQLRRAVGVDIFLADPTLLGRVREFATVNVDLIKSIPQQYFEQVESVIAKGFRRGTRAANLAPEIAARFGVSERRARFIARDQIAKINGQLTEDRQTELGIDSYIWRTSRDERVRSSHRALEGTTHKWSEPPTTDDGRTVHPGGDFQCRCTAEPVISGIDAIKTSPADVPPPLAKKAKRRAPKKPPKEVVRQKARPAPERTVRQPRTGKEIQLTEGQARRRQNSAALNNSEAARAAATSGQRRDVLLWNWVHGSNRKMSIAMKEAAKQEFGLAGIIRNPRGFRVKPGDVRRFRKDLKKLHAETQAELKRHGIKKVKVFRGIKSDVAESGAVESWTTDRAIAEKFGTHGVIEMEVDADRILTGKSLPGWEDGVFGDQGEIVILN